MLLNDYRQRFETKGNHIQFIKSVAAISDELMFNDIKFIQEVVNYMKEETIKLSSTIPIYKLYREVDKSRLIDKCLWYNDAVDSFENTTSGSTGNKFRYKIWKDIYNDIEGNSHYGAIANEFNIKSNAKVLYMHQDFHNKHTTDLVKVDRSNHPLVSYGLFNNAEIHKVIVNKDYYLNPYKYYENIIKYCIDTQIDIIHTKSNVISSLAWNIKRIGCNVPICKLLSNTGSKLDFNDILIMKDHNSFDHWCDNMRCWDGGVTFYTCKHETYHLMDGLSYAYSDDRKLKSIDYYSIPSLFVNYWNGDYAAIENKYERCKCGRAFRHFKIGRTRSVTSLVAADSQIICDNIKPLSFIESIKRVEVIQNHVRFIISASVSRKQKTEAQSIFRDSSIDFSVEEDL